MADSPIPSPVPSPRSFNATEPRDERDSQAVDPGDSQRPILETQPLLDPPGDDPGEEDSEDLIV